MTIVPSVSDFASDFFYAKYDEKKTLVICSLNEEFQTQNRNVVVKRCLILVAEELAVLFLCWMKARARAARSS